MVKSFPAFIFTPKDTFSVLGYFNSKDKDSQDTEFVDGKGYIDTYDNQIWVYKKSQPNDTRTIYPYFWWQDDDIKKSRFDLEYKKYFSPDRLVVRSVNDIISTAKENPNDDYDKMFIDGLNAQSEKYRPVVYATDDFLKKITKTILNVLSISMAKIKPKLPAGQPHRLSNMQSGLNKSTKMSVPYYNSWAELLQYETVIIAYSKDTADDKLPEPIVYMTEKDSAMTVSELKEEGIDIIEFLKSKIPPES